MNWTLLHPTLCIMDTTILACWLIFWPFPILPLDWIHDIAAYALGNYLYNLCFHPVDNFDDITLVLTLLNIDCTFWTCTLALLADICQNVLFDPHSGCMLSKFSLLCHFWPVFIPKLTQRFSYQYPDLPRYSAYSQLLSLDNALDKLQLVTQH